MRCLFLEIELVVRKLTCLFALLLFLAACSSDEGSDPDAGLDDVGDDADADAAIEPDPDAEPDADVDEDPDVEVVDACDYQLDCDEGTYCHDGECQSAPECNSPTNWQPCVTLLEEIDEELGRRAYCDGEYCQVACWVDEECPDGHLCTNDGECIPFTGDLSGEHPGGDESAPLQAGIGEALMHFPIGLPLGGYGNRASSDDGRYGESLAQSHGKMHGLYARGVALDDGERQLLFLRAPIIFPSMAVHEAVARNLQAETGADWRSSLVISGTHTHSGPARFWQIPDGDTVSGPGLGAMGIGEYHDQAYQWLVDSLTEAAFDAIDDLAPAKMGWEVVESFDVDDVISSDRRGESPPFDDNRVLLMRIDDPDDNPRGLLMSFGTHGTIHTGPYANGDALVGAERVLEYALGEEYDRSVPVMYFNQNGGTMSPRGGSAGHDHTQRFENLGHHLVDRTFEAIQQMETTDEWSFNGHTHRFPIIHDYLGYSENEFEQYLHGGLMCSGSGTGDGYHEHMDPENYSCLGLHTLLAHRPATLFSKSQISAFQLNDLTLVTAPGELAMSLGWQIQREIRDAYGIDPFDSFTWGYAQDHLLYLLPTNLRGELPPFPGISTPQAPDDYPEYAFSFLQGGYESQMHPWGHRTGDYIVDRAVEAVGLLLGESVDPAHPIPYPDEFTLRDSDPFPVDAAPADEVGVIVDAPDGEVERREYVEVAWVGGDPGAEMPQAPRATLQRYDEVEETFEPVMLASHRPYDNREFVMLTRLREDADEVRREWVVYWEELHDFPTGSYRFHIDGHYLDEDTGERTSYEVSTDPFELVPSTELIIDEVDFIDETTLSFRFNYPGAAELNVSGTSGDRGAVSGSFRMHHRQVPSGVRIPVDADDIDTDDITVDIDRAQGPQIEVEQLTAVTEPENNIPVTRITVDLDRALSDGDEIDLDISAADLFENSATLSTTLEFTP